MKNEKAWLNTEQIVQLFDRNSKTIRKRINNTLQEECDNSVVAKFATTAKDGKTYQVDYYNLDMIISVGYRFKNKKGIIFRRWANQVLKDYLIKGYSVNQKRLEYLEKTIELIDIAGKIDQKLNGNEAQEIIKVINNYSNFLNLLDDYNYRKILNPKEKISRELRNEKRNYIV